MINTTDFLIRDDHKTWIKNIRDMLAGILEDENLVDKRINNKYADRFDDWDVFNFLAGWLSEVCSDIDMEDMEEHKTRDARPEI